MKGLLASVIVGVVLAMSGAFGTSNLHLGMRLIYWIGLAVTGTVIGTVVHHLVALWMRWSERLWMVAAVNIAILSPLMMLIVWAPTDLMSSGTLNPQHLMRYLLPVLILTVALTALNMMVQSTPVLTHAPATDSSVQPVRFLERLPAKLKGARLLAVNAEDHYRGQDLILLRLSDAIQELEGFEGAQVHRSWWVARDAVESARRRDGRAILSVEGGLEVPVSRQYVTALKSSGWL